MNKEPEQLVLEIQIQTANKYERMINLTSNGENANPKAIIFTDWIGES